MTAGAPAQQRRALAAWLPADTSPLRAGIVRRALCDVGICETPPGSNRSGRIDEYVRAVGSPLGSYWCACAVAAWWREAGAWTPPHSAGSCDEWLTWAKATGRYHTAPALGAAVLYGKPGDASHIGVIVRVTPLLLAVEGNTALEGFSRNGVAVDLKLVSGRAVLGYVYPEAP
jgi:hypothetical protein